MPVVGDPRLVVRMSLADWAVVDGAAAAAGVATAALVRAAAVRAAGDVAREVLAGRLRLRARSASGFGSSSVVAKAEAVRRGRPVGEPVAVVGDVAPALALRMARGVQ